jgi:hypothetical protein
MLGAVVDSKYQRAVVLLDTLVLLSATLNAVSQMSDDFAATQLFY